MLHHSKNKGVALIITLWALVFLAVIAAAFSFAVRMGSASARNFNEDTKEYYLAVSAYEEALNWLLTDKDATIDYVDEQGLLHTDEDRDPIAGERKLEGATVNLEVTDENSRIDINYANPALLKNLFDYANIPEDKQQELIDSMLDWIDPDDLHRLTGAEDEYYKPLGYKAKNASFSVPQELLLVKGFTPEILNGSDKTSPIIDYITTWGRGLNINTLSPTMMEIIGMNPLEVDAIISGRRNGIVARSVPQGMARLGGTITSTTFRIVSIAQLDNNPMAVKITAIVRRTPGTQGPSINTLYCKEEVEHRGA